MRKQARGNKRGRLKGGKSSSTHTHTHTDVSDWTQPHVGSQHTLTHTHISHWRWLSGYIFGFYRKRRRRRTVTCFVFRGSALLTRWFMFHIPLLLSDFCLIHPQYWSLKSFSSTRCNLLAGCCLCLHETMQLIKLISQIAWLYYYLSLFWGKQPV